MVGVEYVEQVYRHDLPPEQWLRELVARLPWTSRSCVAQAYELDLSDVANPKVGRHASLFGDFDRDKTIQGHRFLMQGQDLMRLYRRRVTSARTTFPPGHPIFQQFLADNGIRDGAAVVALDAKRVGVTLSVLSKRDYALGTKERYVFTRIAAHIAASFRMRSDPLGACPADRAEAIFTSEGRLVHATGEAKQPERRGLLREFFRRVERARGPLRHTDSMEALDAWTALLDGRWSLVDHVDSDGRRHCLFVRNDPDLGQQRALNTIERQVVALAALGLPNKLIAYELGIALAAVTSALHLAMQKLNIGRRAELVRVLGVLADAAREEQPEHQR